MNLSWIQGFECALRAGDTGRAGQLEGSAGQLEGSPSGRPCRSYGARLLRAGASEGPASPGLAGGALLSRDGVARRLRESAQLLRTRSATLPRPVAGNGVQGGGLRALW